ncbi:hypothetical protein KIV56_15000 [Cryobacterium breve]|jgi:hypothetical protein|uniref:Uncharacterized protein n=1 Tax=Cryobacterium breve TaxID=1259258 RepID=A0ABY7NBE1_9MICO|nr:hypothetical protein [Cryobacterium breve]WBM79599.1 hypothetical protein KIV56_15000 [Cryobacterium breve]
MGNRLSLLVGPLVVLLYAAVMVLTITVWDPAAAVPSLTYPEIIAGLNGAGISVPAEVLALIVWAYLGVGLALVLSILGFTGHAGRGAVAVGHLALIVAGAPAYFWGSFSLGMDVADTFGVSGGDHTRLGGVLYAISGVALLALVAVTFRMVTNRRPVRLRREKRRAEM